jgi:glucose/mannose-6-phosphate isomerase
MNATAGSDPMRGWVESFPEMLEEAWNAPGPADIAVGASRILVMAGMGGSGMAGLLASMALAERGVPVVPWRDPVPPGWIGQNDALISISYSGETWETNSILECAIARGIPTRGIASGGRMADLCARSGVPCLRVPPGMAPRASLPWLLAGVFRATGGLGTEAVAEIAALLRRDRVGEDPGRDPKALAAAMEGRIVCLLPAGADMEPVAVRWRNQILENGKQAAIVSPVPEMAHNEIMGWPQLRETVPEIVFVGLPGPSKSSGTLMLLRALEAQARDNGHQFISVAPPPGGGFPALLADVQLGDRVSIELADRRGVAATPVEAIRRLRDRLGKEKVS